MLKFFRKIRQQLIKEGKVSRYLIYAIGEILLVMIGILLALQVNNWNENNKAKKLETNYLERISSDLRKDTSILKQKIRFSNQLIKGYESGIFEMYKEQKSTEDYADLVSVMDLNVDELILSDVAYSELVNAGKLDLITDDTIKMQITEYYRTYKFVASRIKELNESNLASAHASSSSAPNLKYYAMALNNRLSTDPYMFNEKDWAYINDPTSISFRLFEETIYYYMLKQQIIQPFFRDLDAKSQELIASIQQILLD